MNPFARQIAMVVFFSGILISMSVMAGKKPGTLTPEGKGYFYYLYDFSSDADGKNKFDISRMYVGTKYQISEQFMARYLTNITHQSGDGKFEVFTKYAYVDWDLKWHKTHLLMGLQRTNNWSMPEKAWGYRAIRYSPMESFGKFWSNSSYVARLTEWVDTLQDGTPTQEEIDKAAVLKNQINNFTSGSATKMGSSADLGIGFKVKPSDQYYVNVMIRNGGGYKKAENDKYKNFQVRAGFYLMEKALHISAYVELEPWNGVDNSGATKQFMNFQWDAMAHYQQKGIFSVGVDINSKTFAGDFENITATCISGFGNAFIIKEKLKVLARFDMYTTGFNDAELQPGMEKPETNGSMIIAGLDWMPAKKVHIMPNVQITSYEDNSRDSNNEIYIHLWFEL